MILCTISQFNYNADMILDDLTMYQLSHDEQKFITLIQDFHARENDNVLPLIISNYEQLFEKIDSTRLVVLKILKYNPNIKPLHIDNSRLQSVIDEPKQSIEINNTTDIEPMLKFLSGNME